jgi:hypothetical protein
MSVVDREGLARLLGMLGSHHDGEVLTAGRMAHKLIREADTTWSELLSHNGVAIEAVRQLLAENDELRAELSRLRHAIRPRPPQPWRDATDKHQAIEDLLLWVEHLSEWEQEFLCSLLRRRRPPTGRQIEVLVSIGEKVDRLIRSCWAKSA